MIFRNEEEFVYRDCNIRMSKSKLSDVLYATIMCHAAIVTTYGVGIYNYSRAQNSYNGVDLKVHIHPDEIEMFQILAGVELKEPIQVQIN